MALPSIPKTIGAGSADHIPIIKYNAAARHQSGLGVGAYSYGPPQLASLARYPLLN